MKHNLIKCAGAALAVCFLLLSFTGCADGGTASAGTDGTAAALTLPETEPPCPVSIGGVPADKYVIVAANTNNVGVKTLIYTFRSKWGVELTAVGYSDIADNPPENAIYVGMSASGKRAPQLAPFEYAVSTDGTPGGKYSVVIDCPPSLTEKAVDGFVFRYITPASADGADITPGAYSEAVFSSDGITVDRIAETRVLAEGIVYRKIVMKLADGEPLNVHTLSVAPGSGKVGVGCAGDADTVAFATTPDQLAAARVADKNAVAAVNAGFFTWASGAIGLCVSDGKLIHGVETRSFFGITNDGAPVCGEYTLYAKYAGKLSAGVNGSNHILKNGAKYGMSGTVEFESGRQPRTAAGYAADGTVILAVADGRAPGVSVGASLFELSSVMKGLGAREAVNLDGGGSCTMSLVNGEIIETVNTPSDGAPRTVFDTLIIYKNK